LASPSKGQAAPGKQICALSPIRGDRLTELAVRGSAAAGDLYGDARGYQTGRRGLGDAVKNGPSRWAESLPVTRLNTGGWPAINNTPNHLAQCLNVAARLLHAAA
jgi:hypothetical protein